MYLGELTRYILCDLTVKGLLFQGREEAVRLLSREGVFPTANISAIEAETEGDTLGQCWTVLHQLGLSHLASHLDAGLVIIILTGLITVSGACTNILSPR